MRQRAHLGSGASPGGATGVGGAEAALGRCARSKLGNRFCRLSPPGMLTALESGTPAKAGLPGLLGLPRGDDGRLKPPRIFLRMF